MLDPQRGRVAVADPDSLAVRHGDESVAEQVSSSVIDGEGRLWLVGAGSSDLVWFDGPARHRRPGAVRPGPAGADPVRRRRGDRHQRGRRGQRPRVHGDVTAAVSRR
jgi:hypothetical protein